MRINGSHKLRLLHPSSAMLTIMIRGSQSRRNVLIGMGFASLSPFTSVVENRSHEHSAKLFLDAHDFSARGAHIERAAAFVDEANDNGKEPCLVLGFHGTALGHALSDHGWQQLGALSRTGASQEEAARTRRTFSEFMVRSHRRSALSVIACARSLRRWMNESPSYRDVTLESGAASALLLPSVRLVPSMVFACWRAQADGHSYMLSPP